MDATTTRIDARLEYRGASCAVRWYGDDVLLSLFWGTPDFAELHALTRAFGHKLTTGAGVRALLDVSHLAWPDPEALRAIEAHVAKHRNHCDRVAGRLAIVCADGWVGAAMAGVAAVAQLPVPLRLFHETGAALDWLAPDQPSLLDVHATWVAAHEACAPIVRRLRHALADDVAAADVTRLARRLGLSARTLQRQLRDSGTSFRSELLRARIERAKHMLVTSDRKISAIGRAIGVASDHRFRSHFRRATGLTPGEWRARHRRCAGGA